MKKISVTIITKNEEKNILRCLESVKPVADEIIVVDSLSSDNTAEICRAYGCVVILKEFAGYGLQKQFAVDQASNEWIFSVDADEVVTPQLSEEILQWKSKAADNYSGYTIPRSLLFMGKVMKHSGVAKESLLRLFDRRYGGFTNVPVHEKIVTKGHTGSFKNSILHYSYRDISHHIEKINIYTSQAAEGYRQKKRKFSRCWVAFKFPVTFFTFYFLKGGFLDGYQGFMWSFLAAFYASVKIAKSIELQTQQIS